VGAGSTGDWVSYSITSNQFPKLTASVPVSALFAALVPEEAGVATILPNVNFVYQTTSTNMESADFVVNLASSSPMGVQVYVDVPQ
jgi:hypothetical protein